MRVGLVNKGMENLGLEYISSVLKENGHQVKLFNDPDLFGVNDNVFHCQRLNRFLNTERQMLKRIKEYKPHILGFSVYTTNYSWCLKIAKQVKESTKTTIVFGGYHPTLLPKEVMKHKFVDFSVRGEGEFPFLELIEYLGELKRVYTIKNLVYRKNGRIRINPLRPPIDINKVTIDKQLFERVYDFKTDYLITTSRGCVFSCTYCCESAYNNMYNNRYYRRRKVSNVINELIHMKRRYNFKKVFFFDAIFFSDKRWFKELMGEYKKKIKVPFKCEGHVKFFNEEVAKILKESNCYGLVFGVQTMNETIRRYVLKRYETNKEIEMALRICDRFKIHFDIDHMFGLPCETERDYIHAAKFYSSLRYLNRVKYNYLTYFPSTEIVSIARKKGILGSDEVVRINKGLTNSFFDGGSVDPQRLNRTYISFERLYRILPIFPKRLVHWFLDKKRYMFFYRIPSPLILFIQICIAVKNRDFRFWIYAKRYLHIIPQVMAQKLELR